MSEPKIYTTIAFTGYYPIGVSALVCANNTTEAADLLNAQLKQKGLLGDAEPRYMVLISHLKHGEVVILQDGNY